MDSRWATLALLAPLLLAGCLGADDDRLDEQAADLRNLPGLADRVVRSLQIDDRWSGEPSILALSDGTLLITGASGLTRYAEDPVDAPGNAGQSYIWRSTDNGASWSFVALPPAPADELLPYRNAVLGVEGDLAEDEAGRAYFVDLTALVGNGLSASDDSGATWTAAQHPLVGLPGTDRPWVAAIGDGEVYVKYLQVQTGHRVARSTDGGMTFPEDVALPSCGQADMTVDLLAQQVLVPCVDGAKLSLLRTDAGAAMEWQRVPVLTAEGPASNVFTSLAVAGEGHYVYAYSEDFEDTARVRVTTSTDHGETWGAPVTLSAPSTTAVFPWVDANQDGEVAVVWYEAIDVAGPPDEIEGTWYPFLAQFTLDEIGDTATTAAITVLSEDPVHEGAICTSGLGCVLSGRSEDRRLLDFFEVDVDAAGTAHVTWTSTLTDVPTIWYGQALAP